MPRLEVNVQGPKQVGAQLRPRSRRTGTGQVDTNWRGVLPPIPDVRYLVVAGGGAGGVGGGAEGGGGTGVTVFPSLAKLQAVMLPLKQ